MPNPIISAERREVALESAQDAFWGSIATAFPEAKSGDLSPDAVVAFSAACGLALDKWLDANMPANTDRLADTSLSISFEFGGTEIVDPYQSECGRFFVDPSYYGFAAIETGGGCKALCKELQDGRQILITDVGGNRIPDRSDAVVLIGTYDTNGQEIATRELQVYWPAGAAPTP